MYEKFTDRSRKVMQLANQQAQRFNHEFIDTEHILLGVLKEESGMAVAALRQLNINPVELRLKTEQHMKNGPDMVSFARLPQMPKAKRVIEYAMEFSREQNHNYVGTEHLLVGLLREKQGLAYQILDEMGVTEENVVEVLKALLNQSAAPARRCTETEAKAALWRIYCVLTMHAVEGTNSFESLKTIAEILKEIEIS